MWLNVLLAANLLVAPSVGLLLSPSAASITRRASAHAALPAYPVLWQYPTVRQRVGAPQLVATAVAEGAGGADTSAATPAERSVLVLGWFFASKRELDYVRRAYARNGYTHIEIVPSAVSVISKPRGWYRTIRRQLQPTRASTEPKPNAHLGRHYDVVHCLSGGFLAMYVLRRSGVPVTFSSLLLDSTPILPKPAAFTRFTRAYLNSVGLTLPLKLLPSALHLRLVQLRWNLGLMYVQLRHRLLSALGREQGAPLEHWTQGPVGWALKGDYTRVARHALGTIYQAAERGARVMFVANPDDPYIDTSDVEEAAQVPPSRPNTRLSPTPLCPHGHLDVLRPPTFLA